jgi:hypothetical protein
VVEDLALARLGLGDQGVIKDVEDILADLLELGLDLLAVVADDGNVLVGTLLLLLLLDRGDDAPRGTSGTDDVLVGDREEVTLVNGEFTTDLVVVVSDRGDWKLGRLELPWRLPVMANPWSARSRLLEMRCMCEPSCR